MLPFRAKLHRAAVIRQLQVKPSAINEKGNHLLQVPHKGAVQTVRRAGHTRRHQGAKGQFAGGDFELPAAAVAVKPNLSPSVGLQKNGIAFGRRHRDLFDRGERRFPLPGLV